MKVVTQAFEPYSPMKQQAPNKKWKREREGEGFTRGTLPFASSIIRQHHPLVGIMTHLSAGRFSKIDDRGGFGAPPKSI